MQTQFKGMGSRGEDIFSLSQAIDYQRASRRVKVGQGSFYQRKVPTAAGTHDHRAFTLVELVVVLALVLILGLMVVPAISKSHYQSRVTACTANYRQWGVACNLYANDHSAFFPSFNLDGPGGSAWDVSLDMITGMGPYGVTVPMWFCPTRPADYDATFQRARPFPLNSLEQLQTALRYSTYNYATIYHELWIPRKQGGGSVFPKVISTLGIPNPNAN